MTGNDDTGLFKFNSTVRKGGQDLHKCYSHIKQMDKIKQCIEHVKFTRNVLKRFPAIHYQLHPCITSLAGGEQQPLPRLQALQVSVYRTHFLPELGNPLLKTDSTGPER